MMIDFTNKNNKAMSPSNTNPNLNHQPVLLNEVVDFLSPSSKTKFVDCTFGYGGHSKRLLDKGSTVLGIDKDPKSIALAKEFELTYPNKFLFESGCFGNIKNLVAQSRINNINGLIADLGVSTPQLMDSTRGFSFMKDGPLDMRMSKSKVPAHILVNQLSYEDLKIMFKTFGEELKAANISKAICREREKTYIDSTLQLANIIKGCFKRYSKTHPATKSFQAIRMVVNQETSNLVQLLYQLEDLLPPQSRLAIITFHSIEDRIVKQYLMEAAQEIVPTSRYHPCGQSKVPTFKLYNRKPTLPSTLEIDNNPSSRSAKLRCAFRTSAESRHNIPQISYYNDQEIKLLRKIKR